MATLDDLLKVLQKIEAQGNKQQQATQAQVQKKEEPKPLTLTDRIKQATGYVRSGMNPINARDFTGISNYLQSVSDYAKSIRQNEKLASKAVGTVSKAVQGMGQNPAQSVSQVANAVQSVAKTGATATAAGAGGAEAAGGVLAGVLAIPGVGEVVGVVAAAGALAAAFASLIKAVYDTSQQFLESQRQFAESSSALASVFARFDAFNELRNQRIGEAIAPGAGRLEQSLEGLLDTLTPYTAALYSLVDYSLAEIVDFTTGILQKFEELELLVAKGLDYLPGVSGVEQNTRNILKQMRKGDQGGNLEAFLMLDKRKVARPGPA